MHKVKVLCYECPNQIEVTIADDEDFNIIVDDKVSRCPGDGGVTVPITSSELCDYDDDASIPEVLLCRTCMGKY